MTEPTTAAGRALAARAKREAFGNWEGIAQFEIPAIEAEARQQDTALLERIAQKLLNRVADVGNREVLAAIIEEEGAALPPSAPPEEPGTRFRLHLGGERDRSALCPHCGRLAIVEDTAPPSAPPALDDANEPERTYTEDEYIEYGVVQYRRGSAQAKRDVRLAQGRSPEPLA